MKVRHTIDFNGKLISKEVISDEESQNTDYEDYLFKKIKESDSQ